MRRICRCTPLLVWALLFSAGMTGCGEDGRDRVGQAASAGVLAGERFPASESRSVRLAPLKAGDSAVLRMPPPWGKAGSAKDVIDLLTFVGTGKAPLDLPSMSGPTGLRMAVDFAADAYTVLKLRMRAGAGAKCELQWRNDLEPGLSEERVTVPIIADGSFHSYEFVLGTGNHLTWVSRIIGLRLSPSDAPGALRIEAFEAHRVPCAKPLRLTLEGQTHRAYFGSLPPWPFVVPEGAVFETYAGMLPRGLGTLASDGVHFRVFIESGTERSLLAEQAKRPPVLEQTRGWVPMRVDLSAYAGKTVRLDFEVDRLGSKRCDYAFWASPTVYSVEPDPGFVPVFLLSWDTVRADHLSCYGYTRQTTPFLDAFAQESVLFENAITQETSTLRGHMSMLTGLYPKHHGVDVCSNLAESTVTLAEALAEAGYMTAGFTGFQYLMAPERGFAQGFDHYSTPVQPVRDIFAVYDALEPWLLDHPMSNIFLFFHNYDAHAKHEDMPYAPPRPDFLRFSSQVDVPASYTARSLNAHSLTDAVERKMPPSERERAVLMALYDDCLLAIDDTVHGFMQRLRALGLYEKALIIVTADHGEEFGEHGAYGHISVFRECARVPLLIRFPGGRFAAQRFEPVVQLVDLMPTILAVAGIDGVPAGDGQDLRAVLDGRAEARKWAYCRRFRREAAQTNTWKILRDRATGYRGLFDVAGDPGETRNVYEGAPATAASLASLRAQLEVELDEFYATSPNRWRFAVLAQDKAWSFSMELSTKARFERLAFLKNRLQVPHKGNAVFHPDGRTLTWQLQGEAARDDLVISTRPSGSPILATFRNPGGLSVLAADGSVKSGVELPMLLRPEEWPRTPPQKDASDFPVRPAVMIWYEGSSQDQSIAPALSPEAVEALEALGYLADLEDSKKTAPGSQ